MRNMRRPADLVLADLNNLRDLRCAKHISEEEYHRQHDSLWDELREGDWERRDAELRKQYRANDKRILARHGYRSIRDALSDGWKELFPTYGLVGGQQMRLSKHTLIKNYKHGSSETEWKRRGYRIREGEKPAGMCLSAYGGWSYGVYTSEQVEKTEKQLLKESKLRKQDDVFILPKLLGELLGDGR